MKKNKQVSFVGSQRSAQPSATYSKQNITMSQFQTLSVSSNDIDEDIKDPACDPDNPKVIRFEDISAAAYRIKDGILRTSCDPSKMNQEVGMEMYFKKDYLQYTGSFKERGARFTLLKLNKEQRKLGVIAASAGNHAQALAYHGTQCGVPVTVVMPIVAPIMKVENCKKYGAQVIIHGADLGESKSMALRLARKYSLMYVNGYDHPDILAGQGTMGLEILDQVPDLDAIVIPVGGGGLIAGCALAIKTMKPDVLVIGVEPINCSSFSRAMQVGHPLACETRASLADGLTVPTVGVNAFATGAPLIDKIVSVSEAWIAIAILRLLENEKAVVEGAGATGLAAILAGLLPELQGKKVVLPICGGNIDTTLLGRCLERGLAADGRLVNFLVTVSDRPGGIAELARIVANVGVSIKDIVHERAWVRQNTFAVEVRILAETRNRKHSKELFKLLRENYEEVTIHGFYETPQDYVSGNLNSEKFESVEEETPFEGEMNIQYNQKKTCWDCQMKNSLMSKCTIPSWASYIDSDLDRYDDEVSLSRDEEQTLSLPREDGLISRGEHQTIREDEEEDSAISSLNTDISTASADDLRKMLANTSLSKLIRKEKK